MEFTKYEVSKLEVLVSEKIDDLQEFSNNLQKFEINDGQFIQELIKEYEEIEKKLNVLYKEIY